MSSAEDFSSDAMLAGFCVVDDQRTKWFARWLHCLRPRHVFIPSFSSQDLSLLDPESTVQTCRKNSSLSWTEARPWSVLSIPSQESFALVIVLSALEWHPQEFYVD